MTEAEVVVLGLGVGGERVATGLADAGCRVVGIEARLVGGECGYWGCVPTKTLVRAATLLAEARRVDGCAGTATVEPDWIAAARRVREVTSAWDDRNAVERLRDQGVQVVRGSGRFTAPHTIAVGDHEFVASHAVVIATGTGPAIPPIPGLEGVDYWTNREIVAADALPDSLVVLGGGAVGLELAQTVRRFGPAVTLVEADDRLASAEEPEVGDLLERVLRAEGMDVRTGVSVDRVDGIDGIDGVADGDADTHRDRKSSAVTVRLGDGDRVAGDRLLVATGRTTNLRALDVARAGLDEDAPAITVDEHLRAAPGIWAVGDVTGIAPFTHVAAVHAAVAVADILGEPGPVAQTHAIPRVMFTDPEVGAVGLTEAQARDRGLDVAVGHASASDSARAWMHGTDAELVKLVADAREEVLVGATVAGPMGGEVLSMLTLAVHARVALRTVGSMIYAYPTFHRTIESALDPIVRG